MPFQLLKVLPHIAALYQMPRNRERFQRYMHLLQGDSADDILLPIAGFNPMGKALATDKLDQLLHMDAEGLAARELARINAALNPALAQSVQVALNLVDDVEGAWSEYYSTDYTHKFDQAALVKRHFCTPVIWTHEAATPALVAERVREAVFRTLHWMRHGEPATLQKALAQEVFVQRHCPSQLAPRYDGFRHHAEQLLGQHAQTEDYGIKFNFFYGDEASAALGFPGYGMRPFEGFEYAKYLALKE